MDWMRRRLPLPPGLQSRREAFLRGSVGKARPLPVPGDDDDTSHLFLADFGGNLANFLECLPTYIHVTPALQVGEKGSGIRVSCRARSSSLK